MPTPEKSIAIDKDKIQKIIRERLLNETTQFMTGGYIPSPVPSEAKKEMKMELQVAMGKDPKEALLERLDFEPKGDLTTPHNVSPGKTGQESPGKEPPILTPSNTEEGKRLNFLDQPTGCVGFKCPKQSGQRTPFRFCIYECPGKLGKRCKPLPLLLALMERRDPSPPNQFSTTEMLNPPKPMWMKRHYPYWEDPDDLIWMTFGTAWHYVIEKQSATLRYLGMEDDFVIENNGQSFRVEFTTPSGIVILTGRPDLYIRPTKALYDWKTMKYYYTLKYLLEKQNWDEGTYHWQVNIYRKYGFPEAEEMYLLALVKDWNSKLKNEYSIAPTEEIPVPFIRDEMIEEFVKSRLGYCYECELDPTKIRDCLEEERWFTKKPPVVPLRCRDYCPVNYRCEQYQREIMEQSEANEYFTKLKEEDEKNGYPYYPQSSDDSAPGV